MTILLQGERSGIHPTVMTSRTSGVQYYKEQSGGNKNTQSTSTIDYEDKLNQVIEKRFKYSDLVPDDDDINFLDKTYKEDKYTCAKHTTNSGYTIIKKQNPGVLEAVLMSDMEKIVEEYDKKGNILKQTRYLNDNEYTVSLYNANGEVSKNLKVSKKDLKNSGYQAEVEITTYQKDRSYCVSKDTYTLDDTCLDGEPKVSKYCACYDKNGNYDFITSALGAIAIDAAETTIDYVFP